MANDDNIGNVDEALLLVSGSKGSKEMDKQYVKKLANAIVKVFDKHDTVKMRCVGAASLNNAVKAFIIASTEYKKEDGTMLLDASFTTVSFQGDEKTAIVLEVVPE